MADRAAEKLPLRHPVVLFGLMLVLILVFILEKSHQVDISIMGAHGLLAVRGCVLDPRLSCRAIARLCTPPSGNYPDFYLPEPANRSNDH
jgi:hypothetical protein